MHVPYTALALVFILGGSAHAAPKPRKEVPSAASPAEALLSEGIALRRSGNNLGALPKFQEAHMLDPTPRTAAQLGLCLQSLSRWVASEKRLEEALASKDPWIEKNRAILAEALKVSRDNISFIEVLGEPAAAEVYMNGHLVGTLPLATPIKHDGGSAFVEVKASGYVTASQTVQVAPHSRAEVFLKALPEATRLSVRPPEPHADSHDLHAASANDEGGWLFSSPWFWGAAAVVVVGTSVALLLASASTKTGALECATCADSVDLR